MRGTKTERRPGVWKLRVYVGKKPDGTPIQVTRTLDTTGGNPNVKPGSGSRLADRELAKMVAEASAGRLTSGTTTVKQLLDRWLAHLAATGRSPTTIREYEAGARRTVIPAIGSIRLDKLRASDLDKLYASLTAEGKSPATVRRIHALIGSALRQAERWDLVERNVARRASPPPLRQVQIETPSPDEVLAIIQVAERINPDLARMLLIAAMTGCRRGELCALRWTDLDWDTHTLTVARSIYEQAGGGWAEKPTKTHQTRRIGLDDLAVETFQAQRDSVDGLAQQLRLKPRPGGFIFSPSPVGAEPTRPDVLTRFFTRASKQAGVKTHLHALRHFSATQGIASGADVVTVAGRLGHRDPSVTLRVYSHVLEQRDRDVAAAIGASLRRPQT
jgi:integrase